MEAWGERFMGLQEFGDARIWEYEDTWRQGYGDVATGG